MSLNFIEQIIEQDLKEGMNKKNLRFRFPPEPNGYLHIGHVKAICLNFNLGKKYGAPVNLRFDDTNPQKEESKYVDAIKRDIKWLDYKWDKECYASDYFQQLFDWAVFLIDNNLAYIDSQSSEEIASQKGTPIIPGKESPYRDQDSKINKEIFIKMTKGEFEEGEHVLRAKINMNSPNMLMRDPVLYRVINKPHDRTGSKWKAYPMYDWTHGESDYIEKISHSLCTLEFKPHRELYNWFLKKLPLNQLIPKQREFARLNLSYTVTSKRKLKKLIDKAVVQGWDDPRMPTISGLRRRGYTPESLRKFALAAGVSKRENVIEASLLEFCAREHLNKIAYRVNAVLNPIKITLTNYNEEEILSGEINPEQPKLGRRKIPFSKTLYIEREDFKEKAPKKFFRLSLGNEVRLKNAYIIKAESVIKDEKGNLLEVLCKVDIKSKSESGTEESKRKVKGTLHWVSQEHALKVEVNLYDRLFSVSSPDQDKDKDFMHFVNPYSLKKVQAFIEPSVKGSKSDTHFQFQRLGYFIQDKNSSSQKMIFNRTVTLRDNWTSSQRK
tara:strand:- start:35614 stop:37272 length:1659 start_codon:yes stop_codon:yes gene_type:complete